jgi:hypothetical protein
MLIGRSFGFLAAGLSTALLFVALEGGCDSPSDPFG